jgi:regulatory protein YycI of two-component signal transduction system YycFG
MNWKNIKRILTLTLLIVINLFLFYRYFELDKLGRVSSLQNPHGEGFQNQHLSNSDLIETSLKIEFWLLIMVFVLIVYSVYILYKYKMEQDEKNAIKNRILFKNLNTQKQTELLSNVYCFNCKKNTNTTFKEEKMLLGEMFTLVECNECKKEIKLKNNW